MELRGPHGRNATDGLTDAFFEFFPDPVLLHQNGIICAANRAVRTFFAEGKTGLVGRPILQLVHPESRPLLQAQIVRTGCQSGSDVYALTVLLNHSDHPAAVQFITSALPGGPEKVIQTVIRPVVESRPETVKENPLEPLTDSESPDRSGSGAPGLSERLLDEIVHNVPVITFVISADGKVEHVSGAGLHDVAIPMERLIGAHVLDLTAGNPMLVQALKRALSGEPVRETVAVGARYFALNLTPEGISSGPYHRTFGTGLDVTDHVQTTARFEEREQRYVSLFTANHAVISIIDPDAGCIVDANPATERFYGYRRDELIGMPVTRINTLAPEAILEEMEAARTEKRNHFYFKHRLASGEVRDVEVYSSPITIDGKRLLYSIIHDVTERHQVERALQQSEERHRMLIDQASDGIFRVSTEGCFLDANAEACRLFGFTIEELKVIPYERLVEPNNLAEIPLCFDHLQPKEVRRFVRVYQRKDGSTFPAEVSLVLIEPGLVQVIIRDITDRNIAEDAIRRNRYQLMEAARMARIGGWEIELSDPDLDQSRLNWSDELLEIMGYTPGEVTIDRAFFYRHVPAEDQACIKASIRQTVDEGLPYSVTHRMFDRHGRLRWVHQRAKLVYDADRRVPKVTGVLQDITDQVETGALLRKNETRLELTMAAAAIGLWDWEVPTGRCEFNDHWARNLGYTLSEIEPHIRSLFDRLHPDDAAEVRKAFQDQLDGKTDQYRSVHRLRTREGTWRWVLDVGRVVERAPDGTPLRATGLYMDITEHKLAEEAVTRLAGRYAVLSDMMRTFGMDYTIDPSGQVHRDWIMPSMEQILGYTPEDAAAIPVGAVIHPEDRPRMDHMFRLGICNRPGEAEVRARHKDGTYRWLHMQVHPVWSDREGRVVRLHGAAQDVTLQKEIEAELVQARDRAEELSRLKDTFLANMSHEIRTPLTAIIGFADVLYEEAEGETREFIGLIREGGQRLMDTLNSVLALAQLRQGSVSLSPERFDVRQAVKRSVRFFENSAARKGLALRLLVADDAPEEVTLDLSAFERTLGNLLSNAIKFTQKGHVRVGLLNMPGGFRIEVSDTGIGMSEDYLKHLFEEFSQESSGLSRTHEGNGLGLAITKRLVDLMGGEISVESQPEQGSTFFVSFPKSSHSAESLRIIG